MEEKLAIAKRLARAHVEVDPHVKHVFLLNPLAARGGEDRLMLLEVVDGTLEGDPLPIGFAADPSRGIDRPFSIVEISPREYEELADGRLQIKSNVWMVGEELCSQ